MPRAIPALLAFASLLAAQDQPKQDDDKQAERQIWFFSQRAYPGQSIPPGARLNAIRQIERTDAAVRARRQSARAVAGSASLPALTTDSANWSLIGPRPSDAGTATSIVSMRGSATWKNG